MCLYIICDVSFFLMSMRKIYKRALSFVNCAFLCTVHIHGCARKNWERFWRHYAIRSALRPRVALECFAWFASGVDGVVRPVVVGL